MNLLDLVFPKDLYCISCGRPLPPGGNGIALCAGCSGEISWAAGRVCSKCGRPLSTENPSAVCHGCRKGPAQSFRKGYSCALYSGRAAEIVRDMKYRQRSWYAETLAQIMAARYFSEADPVTGELPLYDGLVAVPMAAGKKASRGYDQAALLALGLSRRIGVPYLGGALVRVRETAVMSGLSEGERRQNLEGAFAPSYDMMGFAAGRRFLLVDDVCTTGSSVEVCSATLLSAGAESVDFIVFAITADARRIEDRPAVVESPGQLRAKGPT